jgi:hypothetical protein
VCERERETDRQTEREGEGGSDQLADLCSDSFPAFLVLKPAVVEWTGNERLLVTGFKWLQSTFTYDIIFARHLNFSTRFYKKFIIPRTKKDLIMD